MSTPQKATLVTNTPGPFASVLAKQRLDPMRTTFARDTPPVLLHHQLGKWFGACFHTTGSGVRSLAAQRGWSITEAALWTYAQEWAGFPHYLNAEDGTLYQICDEHLIAVHCGAKTWMRDAMLNGSWIEKVHPQGLALWRQRWPGVPSPQHLFPGTSGNAAYLAVEWIPSADGTFTLAQYAAASALLSDWNRRFSLGLSPGPSVRFHLGPIGPGSPARRLVGHEDLIPFDSADAGRWDARGGWDPGALRDPPKFDWSRVVVSP